MMRQPTEERVPDRIESREEEYRWRFGNSDCCRPTLPKKLKLTPAGVGYAIMRGGKIIKERGVGLIEVTI